MNTKITKEQIQALISNIYGFVRYGRLYFSSDEYTNDTSFVLIDSDGELYEFVYDNAYVCNGSVIFEDLNGREERFTILVVPTDGSGIMPQLLLLPIIKPEL